MIGSLIIFIILLVIVGLLIALVYYVLDTIPVPQPFNRFIKIALMVICCLVVILLLLQMVSNGGNLSIPKLS